MRGLHAAIAALACVAMLGSGALAQSVANAQESGQTGKAGQNAQAGQTGEDTAAPRAALFEALGIPEILEVMREEGRGYGAELGAGYLPDSGGATWAAIVERLYDPARMREAVARGMASEIAPEDVAPLLAFFEAPTGRRIVEQEIIARRAFLKKSTEEAARQAYRNAGEGQAARLALLRAYVEANDLIEHNVAGALTSNLRFYRGLVDGGAYEMSEEEMLAETWGQEAEIRADTEEWLMSYLLMAYAPLSDDEIAAYVELSKTPAGRALNRALFAGFDAMYADLSYALGLAVAQQTKGEDL